MLGPTLRSLADLIVPPRCGFCASFLHPGEDICATCAVLQGEAASFVADGEASVRALLPLDEPCRSAIHALKFGGQAWRGPALGRALAKDEEIVELAAGADCIVPIPLGRQRLRARGFNQAALLAGPLSVRSSTPLDLRALTRCRETAPQATLSREERASIRGAFRAVGTLAKRRVLLLDDIMTTGSTLRAARDAVRQAGGAVVGAVVLAAVRSPAVGLPFGDDVSEGSEDAGRDDDRVEPPIQT